MKLRIGNVIHMIRWKPVEPGEEPRSRFETNREWLDYRHKRTEEMRKHLVDRGHKVLYGSDLQSGELDFKTEAEAKRAHKALLKRWRDVTYPTKRWPCYGLPI